MKTLFLLAFAASAAAGELIELSTAREGPKELRVPENRLVRIESVTWSYKETSYPGPRAGVWWWDGVLTWAPWEVAQGNAFLGPGMLQVVEGDLPRKHVLVLVRLEEVEPLTRSTNQVRVAVEASPDLASWQPVGQVAVPAPAPGQAVYVRVRPVQEGQ